MSLIIKIIKIIISILASIIILGGLITIVENKNNNILSSLFIIFLLGILPLYFMWFRQNKYRQEQGIPKNIMDILMITDNNTFYDVSNKKLIINQRYYQYYGKAFFKSKKTGLFELRSSGFKEPKQYIIKSILKKLQSQGMVNEHAKAFEHYKVDELKEIAKKYNINIGTKKSEIVDSLYNAISSELLGQYVRRIYYNPTIKAHQLLNKYEFEIIVFKDNIDFNKNELNIIKKEYKNENSFTKICKLYEVKIQQLLQTKQYKLYESNLINYAYFFEKNNMYDKALICYTLAAYICASGLNNKNSTILFVDDIDLAVIPKYVFIGINKCISELNIDTNTYAENYGFEYENQGFVPQLPFSYYSYKNVCRIIQDILNTPKIDVNDYDEVGIIYKKYPNRTAPKDNIVEDDRNIEDVLKNRNWTDQEIMNLYKYINSKK